MTPPPTGARSAPSARCPTTTTHRPPSPEAPPRSACHRRRSDLQRCPGANSRDESLQGSSLRLRADVTGSEGESFVAPLVQRAPRPTGRSNNWTPRRRLPAALVVAGVIAVSSVVLANL